MGTVQTTGSWFEHKAEVSSLYKVRMCEAGCKRVLDGKRKGVAAIEGIIY